MKWQFPFSRKNQIKKKIMYDYDFPRDLGLVETRDVDIFHIWRKRAAKKFLKTKLFFFSLYTKFFQPVHNLITFII